MTRDSEPVEELRPLPGRPLAAAELVERWRRLPATDPAEWRADVDAAVDMSL